MVLVFWTHPSHKGLGAPEASCSPNWSTPTGLGSSYAAANAGGPCSAEAGSWRRAVSTMDYAVADLHTREVELEELATAHN